MIAIGIDPGDENVGVALATQAPDRAHGWKVVESFEIGPDDAMSWVAWHLQYREVGLVAVEKFTLYPDKMKVQIGSDFPTCQQLGFVKHLIRISYPQVDFYSYPASTQKTCKTILGKLGIELAAKPDAHHNAESAELQLWTTLLRNGLVPTYRKG